MQTFYIKKDSQLPILAMELIEDGFFANNDFYDDLLNATITFTMIDANTCKPKIKCKSAELYQKKDCYPNSCDKYFLLYQWTAKDTNTRGTYNAFFEITFLDNNKKLIIPIKKELQISIL